MGKELSHEDLPVVLLLVLLRQVPLGTVDLDELEGYAEFFYSSSTNLTKTGTMCANSN